MRVVKIYKYFQFKNMKQYYSSCSSNGSRNSLDIGPKAVYIEYTVIPNNKLEIKILRTVAVSIHLTQIE